MSWGNDRLCLHNQHEPHPSPECASKTQAVSHVNKTCLQAEDMTWLLRLKMFEVSYIFFSFGCAICHVACGTSLPGPGIEPAPWAVKAGSPNHWTARKSHPPHPLQGSYILEAMVSVPPFKTWVPMAPTH